MLRITFLAALWCCTLGVWPALAQSETSGMAAQAASQSYPELLKQLPAPVAALYQTIPKEGKCLLETTIQTETTVIPGLVVINHKEVFISGQYHGSSIFGFIHRRIDKLVTQGKLQSDTARPLHKFFDAVGPLTPDQRATLVNLVIHDPQINRS